MRNVCKCGGWDENFDILDRKKIHECGICGAETCECGLDEWGEEHIHSREAIETLDGMWDVIWDMKKRKKDEEDE
jgi:hypothetical protein